MNAKIKNYLSVAFFAFFGGIGRYYLGQHFAQTGTILANLIGCFLLAFLTYYVIERDLLAEWLNIGLGTGLIGSFTTFSSMTGDFIKYINANQIGPAIRYLVISLVGGMLCVSLGYVLAVSIAGKKKGEF